MQHELQSYAQDMTTTDLIDLTIAELHERIAALDALRRAPFNTERMTLQRVAALECLDTIAAHLNGEEVAA